MTTVTAIGYIGSEVAEEYMSERLVWPQRFNSETTFRTLLQQSLLATAGGPLHKAALKTLETLRDKGLFTGPCRGHMLGTVFFPELKIMHFQRCSEDRKLIPEKSRNAFWIRVLHGIDTDQHVIFNIPKHDTESSQVSDAYRSLQPVYHLKLGLVREDRKPKPSEVCVSEDSTGMAVVACCFLSELTSLTASLIAGLRLRNLAFCLYMLLPLLLKLLLVVFSVRRVKLMTEKDLRRVAQNESTDITVMEAFEVAGPVHKFMIIEGPQPVVVQFFRHYGHPIRDQNSLWVGDRVREVTCMTIICCLFLYFPVGLFISQWSNEDAQYLWLGYQLYAVVAMHFVRLFGWKYFGRTEERIARLLSNGKTVLFKTGTGCAVSVALILHGVNKTAEGKVKVQELIDQCKERWKAEGT